MNLRGPLWCTVGIRSTADLLSTDTIFNRPFDLHNGHQTTMTLSMVTR